MLKVKKIKRKKPREITFPRLFYMFFDKELVYICDKKMKIFFLREQPQCLIIQHLIVENVAKPAIIGYVTLT